MSIDLESALSNPQVQLGFTASTGPASPVDSEVIEAVRGTILALSVPYGESSSSVEDCRARLETEGLAFNAKGKADQAARVTPEAADSLDWDAGVAFIESLPEGSWVSYADFGKAAGTTGQPASNFLTKEWERRVNAGEPHIKGIHRVLSASGELKSSWMPDNETLQPPKPSLSGDDITISLSAPDTIDEGEESETIWSGSMELSFKLPSDWSEAVEQRGAEQIAALLTERFGDSPAELLQQQMDAMVSDFTRENDVAIDPLRWIRMEKA